MSSGKFYKRVKKTLAFSAVGCLTVGAVTGCGGGSSNNDQGTAFSLNGFNSVEASICQPTVFTTAIQTTLADSSLASTVLCVTTQNFLFTQGIRTDKVLLDYEVVGASTQPPSTAYAMTRILGPNNGQIGGGAGGGAGGIAAPQSPTGINPRNPASTLPVGFINVPNSGLGTFIPLPPEVRQWISLNRESLPEPPFQINVTARVSGVTTSGDRLITNPAGFAVIVLEEPLPVITPPAAGFDESTETTDLTETNSSDVLATGDSATDVASDAVETP